MSENTCGEVSSCRAGVWKLVGARAFDDVGREVSSPLGPPMGVAVIDADRIMAMAVDGRTTLPPEVQRAFAAYCGGVSSEWGYDDTGGTVGRVDSRPGERGCDGCCG